MLLLIGPTVDLVSQPLMRSAWIPQATAGNRKQDFTYRKQPLTYRKQHFDYRKQPQIRCYYRKQPLTYRKQHLNYRKQPQTSFYLYRKQIFQPPQATI